MKEFNLEDCIAGKPVVTRDGRAYKFGAYNPDANVFCQLAGWVGNELRSHNIKGEWDIVESPADLFMDTETGVKL